MQRRLSALISGALATTVICTLVACSGDSDNNGALPTAFAVSGVAATGAPLVGVVVTMTDSSGISAQSAVTDAAGRYSVGLTGIPPFVLTVPFNDVDGTPGQLSAVLAPAASASTALTANLNPLTSLITQRVLGTVPTTALTSAQIVAARITPASIAAATQDVTTALQPALTALMVPTATTIDPIGASYQAAASDPLDNLFTLTRFNVHAGQVAVGTDAARALVAIPATGAIQRR